MCAEEDHHTHMLAHPHIYTSNQPQRTSTFVGFIQIFFAKHQAVSLNSSSVKLKAKNHITSSWPVFFMITLYLEKQSNILSQIVFSYNSEQMCIY